MASKIISYGNEIKTYFHYNRLPTEETQCVICWIKYVNLIYITNKRYHETLLVECEYIFRNKVARFITSDITDSESDSDD